MTTKHRFVVFAARARVRSLPPPSILSQARLAPRSTAATPSPILPFQRHYNAHVAGVQCHDHATPIHDEALEIPENGTIQDVDVDASLDISRSRSWMSALTTSLNELSDEEVVEVLDEALKCESPEEPVSRRSIPAFPAPSSSIGLPPSGSFTHTAPTRPAVSLVTLVLAIRARPTYRHILSTISPRVFSALLNHLVHDIGALHLVHLLLQDILTRSFGRLEIVREALEVCCRTSGIADGAREAGQEGAHLTVDQRYIWELLEMLDDSYFCVEPSEAADGGRSLSQTTLRTLLTLASAVHESRQTIDEPRLVRIVQAFEASITGHSQIIDSTHADVYLLQGVMMHAALARQSKAVRTTHRILLRHQWISDDPCLLDQRHSSAHERKYTALGLGIALIRTANQTLEFSRALEWIHLAIRNNSVKPHSKLRPVFTTLVDDAFRCVVAAQDLAALEAMSEVAAVAIASGKVDVDPRVIDEFYKACDEQERKGTMRRFVRQLWQGAVDKRGRNAKRDAGRVGTVSVTETAGLESFLPTGRPLVHLVEYMSRKMTPWEGDDARMLHWLLGTIAEKPAVFLDPTTVGRFVGTLVGGFSTIGARIGRAMYEQLVDQDEETMPSRHPWGSVRGVDSEVTRERLRIAMVTNSYAMIELVKAFTTSTSARETSRPDLAFTKAIVQRYIQHSPPLVQLSEKDLARLTDAFFRIENVDAGRRMLKYLDERLVPGPGGNNKPADGTGSSRKALSVLQGALKTVSSRAGKQYLELLELALDSPYRGQEAVVGERLLSNLVGKGDKAIEYLEADDDEGRQFWKGRLEVLRDRWQTRHRCRREQMEAAERRRRSL